MEYVRHETALDHVEDGVPYRAHLEMRARQGSATAIAELAGPEFPEGFEYLHEWAQTLFGRSGFGMDGIAPLTYTTIADWARLTDECPEPHEVEALLLLDSAMRYRPDSADNDAPAPVKTTAWPVKKSAEA